jgi:hypothetical protein
MKLQIGSAWFASGLLAGIALTVFSAWGFGKALEVAFNSVEMCGHQIVRHRLSPDGSLNAVTFEFDCGATTGFSTHISIIPAHADLPNEAGNAFTTWDRDGVVPLGSWGGPITHLRWINDRKVEIRYDPRANTHVIGEVLVKKDKRIFTTVDVTALPEEPQPQ